MPDCPHFSADYSNARAKFLAACAAVNIPYTTYVHPNLGPSGESLCTDCVCFGSETAERVLIVTSAVHGVEGFCGSAAMTAWLHSGDCMQAAEGTRVILIHALNPYGFAWLRRVNEDNVDLNRNFINHEEMLPDSTAYGSLHSKLVPQRWNEDVAAGIRRMLSQHVARNGLLSMQALVCSGQYKHRDGLFYGGTQATWSHRVLKNILRSSTATAKHIVLLDFHTGLGTYGTPELICAKPADNCVKNWFTDKLSCAQLGNAIGPKLSGTIGYGLRQAAPAANVYSITVEFGTYDVYRVLLAIIADNWLHLRGHVQSEMGQRIKQEVRSSFYPDQDDWCEPVLKRSQCILNEAADGLAAI